MADERDGGTVTCPDCGREWPATQELCTCGFPLEFARPVEQVAQPVSVTRAPGDHHDDDTVELPAVSEPVAAPAVVPPTAGAAGAASTPPWGVPAAGTCPGCGEQNPPERTWCARCGRRLRAEAPAAAPAPPPPVEPRRTSRAALVVVVAITLVLAAGVGAAAWLLTRPTDEGAAPAATTGAPATPGAPTPAAPRELPVEGLVVQASSVQDPSEGDYRSELVLDGALDTAWNHDGDEVPAQGVRLTFTLPAPAHVVGLRLVNGYVRTNARGTDLFTANARVAAARVIGDGGQVDVTLADTRDWQDVAADVGTTATVVLEVVGTYPGAQWQDVALSEVRLLVTP